LPTQIELLVQLRKSTTLRANTEAVESGQGRVGELDEAYRAKATAPIRRGLRPPH
jgi:hypothetical protein